MPDPSVNLGNPLSSNSIGRSTFVRYSFAVLAVAAAWAAREALTPAVGPTALPFISFFPAIAIAAWYGGLGAGVLATLLSAAAANWFFIEPVHAWSIAQFDLAALAAFLVASGFIVGAMEAMHRARARALAELTARERAEAELARLRGKFATTLASVGEIATATADAVSPLLRPDAHNGKRAARDIALLFLAAAVLIVGSTFFVYRMGLIRIHAQEKIERELLVLQQLDDFVSAIKDAETGQRGYLLAGEEAYLQPYTNARQVVRTKLDGLQNLALSGELPQAKVERVATLTEQKFFELEQTIQVRRQQGMDAAVAIVRENQGKQVMDEIRAHAGQMRADGEKEFAAANRRSDWATGLRTATFIGAALLNLAFLLWAFRKISREVGQREMAMLEVSQKQELLATTLGSIGDAVIATDTNGCVLFLNPEGERLTGWKSAEAASRPLPEVFRIVNEQTRQPVDNPVEKVLRLGTVVGLANHTILITKDGQETPIDDSAAPIRLPGGPIFGVVLVFRDVTEQRKAQEAAVRLAAIVQHSGDAMFTKDLSGMVRTWNASAERLFGYRAEEIIGKPVTILLPPDRLTEEDHILGCLREGQIVERFETIRRTKDGRHIPVAVSVSPLRDGDDEIVGASKIIHDITDLVTAREALMREKELLATTLASIGDAVIVTDPEGRITFLNAEAERLTKWTSAEATTQPLPSVFRIINEQTRASVENPVEKVLRLDKVVGLANHTVLIAKDGTEISIDDSAAPIRLLNGPLFGVVMVFRDVTEQRKAEAKLREREERFRKMADGAPVMIWVSGLDKRCTWFNRQWLEFTGRTMEQELGDGWADGVHPDDFDRCLKTYSESFDSRVPFTMEYRLRRHDGQWRWIIDNGVPICETNEQFTGYIGSCIDVTDQKLAEEELRESQERLEGLINSAMDAVVAVDAEQRIVLFNPAAEKMFGCEQSAVIGSTLERFIPAALREAHRQHIANFGRTGVTTRRMGALGALSGMRSNGDEFPIEASISQMEIGGQKLFTVILRDITERKQIEEVLRQSETRFRELVERSPFGIYVVNSELRIAHMNESGQTGAFRNVHPVMGRPFDEAMRILWPEEVAARIIGIFRNTLETGDPYHSRDFIEPRADVEKTEGYEWELHRITLPDGQHGVICYYYDSTRLREAEQREQELRAAAEEANRLKDEFLAIMSHELRNPLNVILGYSELLVRNAEIEQSPQLHLMAEAVKRNARTQSKLISDLLDLSRLRSGKLKLNREIVSMVVAVSNAIDTVQPDAEGKKIAIEFIQPDESLFVEGDPVRLEQIVWNLLNNSVKFSGSGTKISVRLGKESNQVVLTVEDSGQGIDPVFLPHVFELFRQGDGSTTRAQSGMGVGLAVVQQLVDLHHGSITAYSSGLGNGAVFTIKLPLSLEIKPELAPVLDLPTDLDKLVVLVVDDSEDTTEMLAHLLKSTGAVVSSATSGDEALLIMGKQRFDVVLSDISMPGMDGFEFLNRLRALPDHQDVPVLALTGFGRPEDIDRAIKAGFFSHITKPFDLDALSLLLTKLPRRNAQR